MSKHLQIDSVDTFSTRTGRFGGWRRVLMAVATFGLAIAFQGLPLMVAMGASATTAQAQTYPAWTTDVSYTVGEIVSYSGVNYICIQAHTSEAGWQPPNVPALWSVYNGGSTGTAPTTPTGLTATANSSSQVTVTWNASTNATSYDLQVDGTVHSGVTSPYVSSGLAASSTHTYSVRADNSVGDSAYSSSVSATTQPSTVTSPPATPTGLAATANSSSQITVTWNASTNATSYDLQVDGTVHSGVTSPYVSSGLAASSTHTYSVRADDSVGDSAYSSLVSATTQPATTQGPATGVPGAPNLQINNNNGASSVTFTMNMWWGNNGTTWQLLQNGAVVFTASLTDNSPNAQTASATVSGLANGTYSFMATLTNRFGTTTGNAVSYTVTQGGTTNPTAPATPTGLAVTANSSSQITVTWNASPNATSYDLQVDGTVHAGVTSPYVSSGLAASSTHTYSVRADNSGGDSAYSSSVSATTQPTTVTSPPATPTGLAATAGSSSPNHSDLECVDQRHELRSLGRRVDVGFEEYQAPTPSRVMAASSTHTYSVRADKIQQQATAPTAPR